MRIRSWLPALVAVAAVAGGAAIGAANDTSSNPRNEGKGSQNAGKSARNEKRWTDEFHLADCVWSSTGKNDYFILQPGYRAVLDSHGGKNPTHLEITVLDETRTVTGVETRVVEERESQSGRLVEVSRNFYAVCGPASDVFYFGEDVDMYKDGKITTHEGSWTAGSGGAKAGLFTPARPLLGARFYQEVAPGLALDRVEIVSDDETLKTPAGSFDRCVKTEETTPLEPRAKENKIYAPGVGIVQDGELVLTKYGFVAVKKP